MTITTTHSDNNHFNPPVESPVKLPTYTDEQLENAVHDFLTNKRYVAERSTMPFELWLEEDQVLACKVSDVLDITVKEQTPAGLFRVAKKVCQECKEIAQLAREGFKGISLV